MKKDIHVVYIITQLELGGAQKVCLSLFQELKKNQYTSHLIAGPTGPLSYSIAKNKQVYFIDSMKRDVGIKSLWREIHNFLTIVRLLKNLKKKNRTIIVHTHSTKAGIVGRWAAFFARIPLRIHTIHGFAFHNHQSIFIWSLIYAIELITSLITTHFVCVSQKDAKTGSRLFPKFNKKHSIIRAAVETKQFYRAAKKYTHFSSNHFIFGTISCFKPQKNIIDLLQAFYRVYLQNPQVRLEIIGDGIMRSEIEQWIFNHNLTHAIMLHGWQQNVAIHMLRWNCFVLSSLWEGLPCAVIEARLLKLPVVSYNVGGIKEIIEHNKNGLLSTPKDVLSLSQNMNYLVKEELAYKQMKNYCDNFYDYKIETMLAKHHELYSKLLQ